MGGCHKCNYTGPEGEAHYHIIVEQGKVTGVWYMSGNGYWDRDLEPDEWFVEYREEPKKFWPFPKWKWPSFRKSTPAAEDRFKPKLYKGSANFAAEDEEIPTVSADWLQPKVYKGKSMADEELENES